MGMPFKFLEKNSLLIWSFENVYYFCNVIKNLIGDTLFYIGQPESFNKDCCEIKTNQIYNKNKAYVTD